MKFNTDLQYICGYYGMIFDCSCVSVLNKRHEVYYKTDTQPYLGFYFYDNSCNYRRFIDFIAFWRS